MAAPSLFGLENSFEGLEEFPDRFGDAWAFRDLDDCGGGRGNGEDANGDGSSFGLLGEQALPQVGGDDYRSRDLDLSELYSFNQYPVSGYLARRVDSSHTRTVGFSQQSGPLDISRLAPIEYETAGHLQIKHDSDAAPGPSVATYSGPVVSSEHSDQSQRHVSRPSGSTANCVTLEPAPGGGIQISVDKHNIGAQNMGNGSTSV